MDNNSDRVQNDLLKVLAWVRKPTKENLKKAERMLIRLAGADRPPKREITVSSKFLTKADIVKEANRLLNKRK